MQLRADQPVFDFNPGDTAGLDVGSLMDTVFQKAIAKQKAMATAQLKQAGKSAAEIATAQTAIQKYQDANIQKLKNASAFSGLKPVAKAVATAAKIAAMPITAPTQALTKLTSKIPILGDIVGAANNLALMPITMTQGVLEGGRIDKVALGALKQTLASVKTLGPYIQTVISFVPGIGTGVSAAIGAGLALADGKSISEAMLAGVKGAIPGGPAAQAAFSIAQAAIQRKPIDQIVIAALPISDQQKKLLSQGLSAVKDIASGKNVAQSIADNAIKSLPPQFAKAVQVGMAMGHAKSLQDALTIGAKGAAGAALSVVGKVVPKQLGPALSVASNVAKGGVSPANVLAVAKGFVPPSVMRALPTGANVLLSNAANIAKSGVNPTAALAIAKNNLPKGIAPMRNLLLQRANSIPNISLVKKLNKISALPSATEAVVRAIKLNPALLAGGAQQLATLMKTNGATVNDAVRIASTSRQSLLPWRSLAPNTVAFIKKYAPNAPMNALRHAHTNVAGLDASGTTYIVEKGDGPWAIAQKLTGNGANWKMLLDYNKDKKPTVDKNIWVGEVLNLPPSWQKPVAKAAPPAPALPSAPPPTLAPAPNLITTVTQATTSVVPSILQAKAILAAWGKTDGINQGGLPDYGLNAADMSTTMGPRDSLMLMSFQAWDNKTLNDNLPQDGNLDGKTLQALQSWASARASTPPSQSVGIPAIGSPSASPITVPVVKFPVEKDPFEIPAGVIGGTAPSPATPVVAAKPSQATGGSGAAIAIGAVVGGLLFGVPGALVGAAGGAAIS